MTYAFTVDVPAPIAQYDTVHAEVTRRAGDRVDGLLVHYGRETAGGFQVLEIWETKEQCDRFNSEVVGPVIAETGVGHPPNDETMREFQPRGLTLRGAVVAA